MKLLKVASLALLLVSCSTIKHSQLVNVYKPDDSRKCQEVGIDLAEMQQELTENGIHVYCAQKDDDGYGYSAVCGGFTGIINTFEIDSSNLDKATELGFKVTNDLPYHENYNCK